jgi:transposase
MVDANKLRRHYKKKVSGFCSWEQLSHAEEYTLYPENIGEKVSIDEVSLSDGELYTVVTNKEGCGKNGTLIATIKGTKSSIITEVIEKIDIAQRNCVKEVTLDMAKNMESAVKQCFPSAKLVTDRFHVVRLVMEALQHLRVKYRWEELEKENEAIKRSKELGVHYIPKILENGDSPKQLLARSRYILAKKKANWTENQTQRAELLFKNFPLLETAYNHALCFRNMYEEKTRKDAQIKINEWIAKTPELNIKEFTTVTYTISQNMEQILNFFDNRSTNANAESFNAKLKLFRANQRGVKDKAFFLFRMMKLFA